MPEDYLPRDGSIVARMVAALYALPPYAEVTSMALATGCGCVPGGLAAAMSSPGAHGLVTHTVHGGRAYWSRGTRELAPDWIERNKPAAPINHTKPDAHAAAMQGVLAKAANLGLGDRVIPVVQPTFAPVDSGDGIRFRTFADGSLVVDMPGSVGVVFSAGATQRLKRFIEKEIAS